jgi:hypothetical protein
VPALSGPLFRREGLIDHLRGLFFTEFCEQEALVSRGLAAVKTYTGTLDPEIF